MKISIFKFIPIFAFSDYIKHLPEGSPDIQDAKGQISFMTTANIER